VDHAPSCLDKYVYLDQGGELYRSPSIRRLFEQHNYKVCPTGAASNPNGPVKLAHLNVVQMQSVFCYMGLHSQQNFGCTHFIIFYG
jgi:hypothetical protein